MTYCICLSIYIYTFTHFVDDKNQFISQIIAAINNRSIYSLFSPLCFFKVRRRQHLGPVSEKALLQSADTRDVNIILRKTISYFSTVFLRCNYGSYLFIYF